MQQPLATDQLDQVYLDLAEELSCSRAAERLRIAQPTLSRAVQEVEAELGGQRLDRNRPLARGESLAARDGEAAARPFST